jgi:hypothetical protein
MDGDLTRPPLGESGRARLDDDAYPTPALNSAALILGLRKAGLRLPPVNLDPCGGSGMLARVAMRLEPDVDVRLSDISPQREAADLYATLASIDATIPADLRSALRITGARAVVSNFPFKRSVYGKIFSNCRASLALGDIELLAMMQRAQRALDSADGYLDTAGDPRFFGMVACPWRSWLWPKRLGDASPKGAYAWLLYTSTPRRHVHYGVYAVTSSEAEEALA